MPTNQTRHPTTHAPWIWLQERERSGAADDCACRLDEAGPNGQPGAAYYMCAMHEQAPAMLLALRETLDLLERLEQEHKEVAFVRGLYIPSDVTRVLAKIRSLVAAMAPGRTR